METFPANSHATVCRVYSNSPPSLGEPTVNYPQLKAYGLSIELRIWLHSNIVPNCIWTTKEPVYGDSPAGNLELAMVSRFVPLQQGFCGDCQTRLTVTVNNLPASFAFEHRVDGTMSFTHSTAVSTPFRCVPTVHDVQHDSFVKTSLLKILPECVEGDTHHLAVEPFPFRVKLLQVFNSNIGIIFEGKIRNVSNYFTNSVLHEVMFLMLGCIQFHLSKATASISVRKQKALALKYLLTLHPNILPKIRLLQHISFRRQNTDSKAFAVNINSKNILSPRQVGIRLGHVSDNLQIGSQPECFASPAASEQFTESVPTSVFPDWNSQSLLRVETEFNESEASSLEGFAVTRNIEFNSHPINTRAFFLFSPSASSKIADNLTVETTVFLRFKPNSTPKIVEPRILHSFRKKPVDFNGSGLLKARKNLPLGEGSVGLKKDRTLQPTDQQGSRDSHALNVSTQFLPPINGVGFLGEF